MSAIYFPITPNDISCNPDTNRIIETNDAHPNAELPGSKMALQIINRIASNDNPNNTRPVIETNNYGFIENPTIPSIA